MTSGMNIQANEPQQPAKKPWKIGTYEKTQVGVFATPSSTCSINNLFTALPYANEALGVKAEKGNFFAKAEIGAGTSATARVATGYEIPLGKQFGLELSADARAAQSMIGKNITVDVYNETEVQVGITETFAQGVYTDELTSATHLEVPKYKEGNLAAGVNVMAKWHPTDKLSFGAGVRAGVVSANAAHVHIDQNIENAEFHHHASMANGQYSNVDYSGVHDIKTNIQVGERHTQVFVSPAVEFKGKPGKWEIGLSGSFDEGRIEAAYNF